jgi:hypothetical protein
VTDPTAQATADSKSATFYDNNQPAGTAFNIGDMWVDTNDNDKLYVWDGDSWELAQDSAAASSAAQTAYNAAIASLQPSASTIVNASNQITAVNTNGITVYSGGSATTGARIVMNSAGIAGFDATSTGSENGATFSISASTGDAVFKGSIQSGSTITGAAITGSSFTSTNYGGVSGTGVAVISDQLTFRVSGNTVATLSAGAGGLLLSSAGASITMTTLGNISIASVSNSLLMSNAPFFTSGSGSNTAGTYGSIRNTWVSSNDPADGDPGDVWLKWV